ncbi:MAG TPA: hypothetical protein PKL83_01065 [bacterium]|nr:hypothetical protein [bacterium]
MAQFDLYDRLQRQTSTTTALTRYLIRHPEYLREVLAGLQAGKGQAAIKFGCSKLLISISARQPEVLYPYFNDIVALLEHNNSILRWSAIITLAHLTPADTGNKFEKIFARYYAPITGPVMITAANIVKSSAVIARAKPQLTPAIVNELLKVDKARYATAECKKIVQGKAIETFSAMFDLIDDKQAVIKFVTQQVRNTRAATAKKAASFLKKHRAYLQG